LQHLGLEGLLSLMGLSSREEAKKAISQYLTYLRHVKPLLTGSDLREIGYTKTARLGPDGLMQEAL